MIEIVFTILVSSSFHYYIYSTSTRFYVAHNFRAFIFEIIFKIEKSILEEELLKSRKSEGMISEYIYKEVIIK